MRVIAGKAKGFVLKVPQRLATRPATELVRGAIFSILENRARSWEQVLDVFSGSGSLGIEALSRGAGWVDFVEHERRCCAIIRENLEKTGFSGQSHVYCAKVEKAISFLDKEYDIILMDPPYSDSSISETIERLATSPLVSDSTIMVVTHSSRLALRPSYGRLSMAKEHRHGDSLIAVYEKEAVS
jgi:16S rRNA (guanine(966)-N(2))-methyltransferase RsmD